jgi:DNA-binding NtrC family response regulator
MMTATAEVELAVEATKAGAFHFLTKPFTSPEAVSLLVDKARERAGLLALTRTLETRLSGEDGLVGSSPGMLEVYRLVAGVASSASTVMILGESGTGKELVARAIHARSPRRDRPFVAINCAAIPRELVESELFGHVRGAFTGALGARAGLFEAAHTGTLFLDEIGDLPLHAQVKLLRALQEGEIKRVGADDTRKVDVRVVSATNVALPDRVRDGSFRSDLYYRLNVISIDLPPLREREGDLVLLAAHFLARYAARAGRPAPTLSPDARVLLARYAWPGNVRELEHAMERAIVLASGPTVEPHDLPPEIAPRTSSVRSLGGMGVPDDVFTLPYGEAKRIAGRAFDEQYVREVLQRADGNVSAAAKHAGLDRSNFRRVVRKVGPARRAG